MSHEEDRRDRALMSIAKSLEGLLKAVDALNTNFVGFAQQIQASDEAYDKSVSGKGPMVVLREDAVDQLTLDDMRAQAEAEHKKEGE